MNTEEFSELINASRKGDIDGLYTIIQNEPDILRRIDEKMLEHTPMHKAASKGQIRFTNEMMNLMPSFARKLNKEGLTPMHLALQNGHVELVFCLLNAEPDLVRVKGKNGMTTLHCAAEKGYYNLVANLLAICPRCIEDVNVDGETVVHIAVRERRSEVLEVVVGWLRRVWHEDASIWIESIRNHRNVQGRTALDIALDIALDFAVTSNEIKAILLLGKIQAKSSDGRTSKSFLHGRTQQHRSRSTDPQPFSFKFCNQPLAKYLRSELRLGDRFAVYILRLRTRVSDSLRDALLVVAGLLITASFQAAITPPVDFSKAEPSWSIIKDRKKLAPVDFSKAAFVSYMITNSVILFAATCMIDFLLAEVWCGPFVAVFLFYLSVSYTISILFKAPDRTTGATFVISMGIPSFLLLLITMIVYFGRHKFLKAQRCRKNMLHKEVEAVNEEVHGSNAISNESA